MCTALSTPTTELCFGKLKLFCVNSPKSNENNQYEGTSLRRSSLSHDFYQTLAGKDDLGIYGVKQLILWSIQHACLDDDEKQQVLKKWEQQWADFLNQVVNDYDFSIRTPTQG